MKYFLSDKQKDYFILGAIVPTIAAYISDSNGTLFVLNNKPIITQNFTS